MLTGKALNLNHPSQLRIVQLIIRLSLIIQLMGAILLFIVLKPRLGIGKGIWYSIFHSVTAYCNAGFDLFGKIIIIALMFIGRVGIYTFMYSIFKSHPAKQSYRYPEEEIIIG